VVQWKKWIWFYQWEFIKEDIFVHQTTREKNFPRKSLCNLEDGKSSVKRQEGAETQML
jgi:hypothetical protein